MNSSFLQSARFWTGLSISILLLGTFFAWELTLITVPYLPNLPRPAPSDLEFIFTGILILFLALDAGLLNWHLGKKSCPIGVKRATFASGTLGVITLLCPVCLLIPVTLFGATISLAFLTPFLPLLRTIVLFLLITTTYVLWPKTATKKTAPRPAVGRAKTKQVKKKKVR